LHTKLAAETNLAESQLIRVMENREEISKLRGRPLIPVTSKEKKDLKRHKSKLNVIVIVISIIIIIIMAIIDMPPNSDHDNTKHN